MQTFLPSQQGQASRLGFVVNGMSCLSLAYLAYLATVTTVHSAKIPYMDCNEPIRCTSEVEQVMLNPYSLTS